MPCNTVRTILLTATATSTLVLVSAPAQAQDASAIPPNAAPTTKKANPSPGVLPTTATSLPSGEILVTATRRPVALEKVPVAVSVFGAETLRQVSASNIGAVLQLVPGFNFSSESNYRTYATLRGVQGSNEDAAIGLYYDGVYIGQDIAQNLAIIDPASIQVLRGPQGALYGKSTLGGAIVVTSRQPEDDLHANGSVSYGNYGSKDVRGTVTGPIAKGVVDFLLSGYYDENNGTFENVFLNRHVNAHKDYGFQGAIRATPTDRLTVSLSGDYNNDGRDIGNYKTVYTSLPQPTNGLAPGLTNTSSSSQLDPTRIKIWGTNLTAKYDADDFLITSISSYRGYTSTHERDSDFTGAVDTVYDNNQKQSQYSEDITITSPGKRRFNWILGAQYYYSKMALTGLFSDYVGNNLFPFPVSAAPVSIDILVPRYATYSVAAYAQADYKITSRLTLAAGIRYSSDHREFNKTETVLRSDLSMPYLQDVYNQRDTWTAPTPEASLSYQVTDGVLVYGKYSRSYRPGGFNVNGTFSPSQNEFDKETANAYEAGVKGSFLGGDVTTNLTVFQLDWHNQQVSYNGTIGFVTGNANSRSRGVELETSVRPVPGLRLEADLYYLDAKFGSTLQNFRDPITRASTIINVGGTPLLYSPKWSASGVATYKTAITDDIGLLLRGSANYRSSIYLIPAREDVKGPGYTRVDLRAELNLHDTYSIAIFAKNVLNQFSYYFAQSSLRVDAVGVTEPRTYGVQLSFRY